MILSKKGVTPEMEFKCSDCGATITGLAVLNGEYLYIEKQNKEEPQKSQFLCECCYDDKMDRHID